MNTLPADIRYLPIDDRIVLVEALWDSIADDQGQVELTEAQKAEIDRRLAARLGRTAAAPWSEVKRRILGQ